MRISEQKKYKVVLLGDGGVGKTSLVKRFVHQKYDDKYIKTLGTNVYKKDILKTNQGRAVNLSLQIWDVMGQDSFPSVLKTSLMGANGVILVTDLTNKASLENLQDWLQLVFSSSPEVSLVFLANKSDLDNVQFGYNALKKVSDSFLAPYFLTSAKTGDSVNDAFGILGDLMYTNRTVPSTVIPPIKDQIKAIPPLLLAEDNIINTFCNRMGGYEHAMPIVRKQFEALGIDFENPTRAQLQALVDRLLEVMRNMSDHDIKKLHQTLHKYLSGV